ncbi:MAG: 2-succinyl-5-enolpyruvyl-6-hydroxy-3-cyclohexene-1-carboxylic-acid synthase [Frankiales bacterium]|nr:2-succinyl-5-enolpyruvyl-6-hydroxy-3-cyclohexene-1-carboxylic-acid synthase [Frankiales bacterium]
MPREPRRAGHNAGSAFALVVVDELVRHGVTDAVLAPGSRSTPLALAFAADDRVRLHVRIDERSASFLALGLARGTGRPAPLLCTSGTATAHFHAAVLEADQSRVPMLVLTADRPPELRHVGANQTIAQAHLYGDAVRWSAETGVPEARPGSVGYWRSLVSQAVAVSCGRTDGPAGPVHLNVPFREPLVPAEDDTFGFSLDGRPDGAPWTAGARGLSALPDPLTQLIAGSRRGVVVAGDGLTSADATAVAGFAEQHGWPLIAEPHSNARTGRTALRAVEPLLLDDEFCARHSPDAVVVAGRVGLSRALTGWLGRTPHVVVDRDGRWADPTRSAGAVFRADPAALAGLDATSADPDWTAAWCETAAAAGAAIDELLDETDGLPEPRIARDVAGCLADGSKLVVASSMPIRDLDTTMRPRSGLTVVANRGVSGIDGFVSTACGVALAGTGPTYALAGDLSLLHDVNGLLADPLPDLTIVVVNNDGGGIFSLLPQADRTTQATFEKVFGTPHGVHPARVAAAYGAGHVLVETPAALTAELASQPRGLRLVEVRTDREANAELHRQLRAVAAKRVRETTGNGR